MHVVRRFSAIDMYSLRKCLSAVAAYVAAHRGWKEEEYFARFSDITLHQNTHDDQNIRVATFFIVPIAPMEAYLADRQKKRLRLSHGRFPGEFALELDFADFSILREA